ncbi:MAG: hypothetical protein AAB036_00835 [Elusimicrobiota bacterium]
MRIAHGIRFSFILAALAAVIVLRPLRGGAAANDRPSPGTLGLSLNVPGIGVRYFLTERYSFEAKAQTSKNTVVAGLRTYRYFQSRYFLPYMGMEADFINFKGDVTKGTGMAFGLFAGGEHFFARRLSTQFDCGPALIHLSNQASRVSVDTIEIVMNLSVNFYFLGGAAKERKP